MTTKPSGGVPAVAVDVSADLTELGRTPVAVVSAGVKSILDIGLTLEALETLGVPVLVNAADEFPSFYSRSSGFEAPMRVDGAIEIAGVLRTKWGLAHRQHRAGEEQRATRGLSRGCPLTSVAVWFAVPEGSIRASAV